MEYTTAVSNTRESFITGSRAYGTPRPDSDIDLAVVVTEDEARVLRSLSENTKKTVFGRLNLIIFLNSPEELKRYEAWKKVNEALKLVAPVTKDVAIRALDKVGANHSDNGSGDGSGSGN